MIGSGPEQTARFGSGKGARELVDPLNGGSAPGGAAAREVEWTMATRRERGQSWPPCSFCTRPTPMCGWQQRSSFEGGVQRGDDPA